MKKVFLFVLLVCFCGIGAFAQKTVVKMQEVQARLLDVTSNAYVRPLTVELIVDTMRGRIEDQWPLTKEMAEVEMKGDIANIRSYAVYMSSQRYNADVIVAATFNIKTDDEGTGYIVTIKGFPAVFANWKTAEPSDYEWIRLEKTFTTADREKISAIVK